MVGLETLSALIAQHGLVLLAPLAVVEGPIVTVIAAWLASTGLLDVWAVTGVVILADLAGDLLFYALGRWGTVRLPPRWLARIGLGRRAALDRHFDRMGGRTLVFGKLTHSAGAAILVAAGAARMPLLRFAWINLLATVPKSLFFVWLGYGFGAAYARIDGWIARLSLLLLAGLVLAGLTWLAWTWRRR